VRLVLDEMGGDPVATVGGGVLSARAEGPGNVYLHHASKVVEMGDVSCPFHRKKDSSHRVGLKLVRAGRASA
jgi:fatty acid/phospholipid biosynthesis enzyme